MTFTRSFLYWQSRCALRVYAPMPPSGSSSDLALDRAGFQRLDVALRNYRGGPTMASPQLEGILMPMPTPFH